MAIKRKLTSTTTLPVKFLILSDTHDLNLESLPAVPGVDVILHCGDLTDNGGLDNHRKVIRGLAAMDAELKLVIAGNHDIDLDRRFFLDAGGKVEHHEEVVQLWKSASKHNIIFLEEGTHHFVLKSGAKLCVYATPYQPQYGSSAFQYASNQDRFNPECETPTWAVNTASQTSIIPALLNIDIVLSHGPPKYILDRTAGGISAGCEHLRRAVCRTKPLLHCFGHVHDGWGAQRVLWKSNADSETLAELSDFQDDDMLPLEKEFIMRNSSKRRGYATLSTAATDAVRHGKQTLMINAAIGNVHGKSVEVPWLVELQLPTEKEAGYRAEEAGKRRAITHSRRGI